MINGKGFDYDDVRVELNEAYVSFEQEEFNPDLSFRLAPLTSSLPLILHYEDLAGSTNMEAVCAELGVLTAGASRSKVPLATGEDASGWRLFERFDPLRLAHLEEAKALKGRAAHLVVGCSLSARHAAAMANELRLADAVLIGPTQAATSKLHDELGLGVPRVTLVEAASRVSDVSVIATAASSSDVCKALVAGADAALIHLGDLSTFNGDLAFFVEAVVNAVRVNLTELCLSSGSKSVKELAIRCRLVPR